MPVTIWPDPSHDLTHLGTVAQRALVERRAVVTGADGVSRRRATSLRISVIR